MISFEQALIKAKQYLHLIERQIGEPLYSTRNVDEDIGWVFFYQSDEFVRTADPRSALAGNAPFLVRKSDGNIIVFGTAYPIEHYLKIYKADNAN